MTTNRIVLYLSSFSVAAALFVAGSDARAEWDYRDGFGYGSSDLDLRFNLFVQPRFEYETDAVGDTARSTFLLGLAGGRLRLRLPRRHIEVRVTGGVAGDEGLLLDTFIDLGIGDHLGLRFGYFRVPFDEQTTHAPFWLRMSGRSIDVTEMSHWYDLGIALRGNHLGNTLVWSLSMTNGEVPLWENGNIDFLYSLRIALRLGQVFDWNPDVDVIVGLGSSWTLDPWEPETDVLVNRSIFRETFDVTARIRWFSASAAILYRLTDSGAYGAWGHDLGYHVAVAGTLGQVLELATRVAQVYRGLGDESDLEVGVALNGFADNGRLRFQVEYSWLSALQGSEVVSDAHRVVVQLQAFY